MQIPRQNEAFIIARTEFGGQESQTRSQAR